MTAVVALLLNTFVPGEDSPLFGGPDPIDEGEPLRDPIGGDED